MRKQQHVFHVATSFLSWYRKNLAFFFAVFIVFFLSKEISTFLLNFLSNYTAEIIVRPLFEYR